jgi:hypothetical protein
MDRGFTSIYVVLVLGTGVIGGALIGLLLGAFVTNGVTIGLASGFIAVLLAGVVRRVALKLLPQGLIVDAAADKFPRVVLINILIVSLIGGLAGHDLSHETGESSPAIIGALSGLIATLSMVVLMVTYFSRDQKLASLLPTLTQKD